MKRSNRLINLFMEFVQIMMVYLGVASALTCTATSLELVYDRTLFMAILGVGTILFYALFSVLETIKRGKLFGILGLLVFYLALAIRFKDEIKKGVVTIINSFLKAFMNFTGSNLALLTYEKSEDVSVNFSTTLVLVILGVFIVAVVSAFFYRKRRSSIFILCTLPFLLLPLYVGKIGSFIDIAVYLSILIAVIGTRELKTNSTDRKLRQKMSLIMMGIGLFSCLLFYLIVSPARYDRNKEKLLETKNTILSLATWSAEDVFAWIRAYWGDDAIDYGKIGKKSEVTHTGKTLIKLSGDVNSNYGLYLKSFVANVYEDNKWTSNKKDAEYKQDLAKLGTDNITPDSFHVQLRNDVGDNEKSGADNLWRTGTLHVRNLAFGYGNYLIPVLPAQAYVTDNNGELKTRIPGIEYDEDYYLNYSYFVRRVLMNASEDLVDPVFWTTYEEKTKPLEDFAKKYYLQVPDSLKGVCELFKEEYKAVIKQYEEGERDISDILRAVRSFISKDTQYTESPGKTPAGKDTVEYFLRESKKGYCTYYATAAAMLLRSVGIPTRYAEGLYVKPEELSSGPGEIEIPDYDAHAWVEVFDKRFGFVTFEATPGNGEQIGEDNNDSGAHSDGQGTGDGPGEPTPEPQVTTKPEESMEFEDIDGNEDTEDEDDKPDNSNNGSEAGSGGAILNTIFIIFIVLIITAAVAESQRRIRKHLFRKNISDMKNKRRRIRLTHRHLSPFLLHRGIRYSGQSMAEMAAEMVEGIGINESTAVYYVEMVFRGAFGPDDLTEQEMFKFREVYEEICRHAYREASIIKKIYYMYVMVL